MITPELLARAVASFVTGPQGTEFLASLPLYGEAGTVRKIGSDSAARGHLRAKSGSIERVKCYTGVVNAASGARFVFAIMANNFEGPASALYPSFNGLFEAMVSL